jgi:hypothetical protein
MPSVTTTAALWGRCLAECPSLRPANTSAKTAGSSRWSSNSTIWILTPPMATNGRFASGRSLSLVALCASGSNTCWATTVRVQPMKTWPKLMFFRMELLVYRESRPAPELVSLWDAGSQVSVCLRQDAWYFSAVVARHYLYLPRPGAGCSSSGGVEH